MPPHKYEKGEEVYYKRPPNVYDDPAKTAEFDPTKEAPEWGCRWLFDAGVNRVHPKFFGVYDCKQYHPPDWKYVQERSAYYGIKKQLFLAATLESSKYAMKYAYEDPSYFFTVGLSPLHALDAIK